MKAEVIIASRKPHFLKVGMNTKSDYSLPRGSGDNKLRFSAACVNYLKKTADFSPRKFIDVDYNSRITQIITIDGPTSSGKNSVGFLLAKKLNYQFIDSGSIYRAGCIFILKNKIPLDDLEKVVGVYKDLDMKMTTKDHQIRVIANGRDVTDILHSVEVTKIVPIVAAQRQVREATKVIQRNLGNLKNTVMTGRDIGSEIFPDARFKFFLTASVEVRAKRRFKQLVKKYPKVKYEDVLKDMQDRDRQDSEREASPLRIPKGAVVIDNSNLTVDETVDKMLKHIRDAQA